MLFASVQNGVILDIYEDYQQAYDRVKDEIKHDWLEIILQKKLRKLLKKSGGVALNKYYVYKIVEVTEIK